MPCYDSRNEPEYQRAEALKEFAHNSPVAELLCFVMKRMEPKQRMILIADDPRLGYWWRDHQARDAAIKKRSVNKRLDLKAQRRARSDKL